MEKCLHLRIFSFSVIIQKLSLRVAADLVMDNAQLNLRIKL